jgi:hypothetical protein
MLANFLRSGVPRARLVLPEGLGAVLGGAAGTRFGPTEGRLAGVEAVAAEAGGRIEDVRLDVLDLVVLDLTGVWSLLAMMMV